MDSSDSNGAGLIAPQGIDSGADDPYDSTPVPDDPVNPAGGISMTYRWLVLVLACFLTLGSNYTTDFPGNIGTGKHGTIQARFVDHGLKYDNKMNQLLYSVYGWPNLVLAFGWGIVADRFLGLRKTMMLGTSLILTSSVVFYVGVLYLNYPVMVAGRVVFALGGESLTVVHGMMVPRWFGSTKCIAVAYGLENIFGRSWSALTFYVSPVLASHFGVDNAVFSGVVCCFISFLSAIGTFILDRRVERLGYIPRESRNENASFRFTDLIMLPKLMWVVSLILCVLYAVHSPFMGIAVNLFTQYYGTDQETGSQALGYFQFGAAILAPFVGYTIDRVGHFPHWLLGSSLMYCLMHLTLALWMPPLPVVLAMLGVAYLALLTAGWSVIPYIVPTRIVGIAFGMAAALLDIGCAVVPFLAGTILDSRTPPPITNPKTGKNEVQLPLVEGFRMTEWMFLSFSVVGVVFSIWLYVVDRRKNGGLLSMWPVDRDAAMSANVVLVRHYDPIESLEYGDVDGKKSKKGEPNQLIVEPGHQEGIPRALQFVVSSDSGSSSGGGDEPQNNGSMSTRSTEHTPCLQTSRRSSYV